MDKRVRATKAVPACLPPSCIEQDTTDHGRGVLPFEEIHALPVLRKLVYQIKFLAIASSCPWRLPRRLVASFPGIVFARRLIRCCPPFSFCMTHSASSHQLVTDIAPLVIDRAWHRVPGGPDGSLCVGSREGRRAARRIRPEMRQSRTKLKRRRPPGVIVLNGRP